MVAPTDTKPGVFVALCRKFTPSVIEPSFGVGRIIYCALEHCFYTRQGSEDKHVFRRAALPSCSGIASAAASLHASCVVSVTSS